MTKRKRRGPTLDQQIQRPWCYYCERDFDDMMILLSHQKAKHFRCEKCNRRLNTAGGLSVHMNQVHKEPLEKVENALPNRQDTNIEIFGTEGIPEQAIQDHQQAVIERYIQAAADRQAATGNLQPGAKPSDRPKRPKLADEGDLKERLKEYVAQKAIGQAHEYPLQDIKMPGGYQQSYGNGIDPYQHPQPGQAPFGFPPASASPGQQMGIGQPPSQFAQRPPMGAAPAGWQDPRMQANVGGTPTQSTTLGTAKSEQPDLAVADAPPTAEVAVKKEKKEKGIKMFYSDNEISPEEKMARMGKYVFAPTGG